MINQPTKILLDTPVKRDFLFADLVSASALQVAVGEINSQGMYVLIFETKSEIRMTCRSNMG